MIALALMLAAAAPAGGIVCNRAGSQIELDVCADQDAHAADHALNSVWRTVIAKARKSDADPIGGNPHLADALLKAQRSWLAFRDQQCAAEGLAYAGGSIRPMIESTCVTRLTRARVKDLNDIFGG